MIEVGQAAQSYDYIDYNPLPTLLRFHECPAQIRCIVGPVGSGKTTAATWEICYYLPQFIAEIYGMFKTSWVIVRNTYPELRDTTMKTVFAQFPNGTYRAEPKLYTLKYQDGIEVEILFRSCDNPDDNKKFKSLEVAGYWIDESIEVASAIKRMLKSRIGRRAGVILPFRFGIETTNPPDVEHETYSQFAWDTPPPGPLPANVPLKNHVGFWQPPYENEKNLRPGYYDDLREDYRDNPDWIAMYIEGKPGAVVQGKLVYNNFLRTEHVAKEPLIWAKGDLWRGWDNSGNCPACVVVQMPRPRHVQVLREFHTDRQDIVDFANTVKAQCNLLYPNAHYVEFADPAGFNEFSKKGGGFTSNAKLMDEECSIKVLPSDQNWTARKSSVERQLGLRDGLLIDPSCTRLINGFIAGYAYNEIGNTGTYDDKPMKNKYSHPHDALQYLMVKLVGGYTESNAGFTPDRSKNYTARNVRSYTATGRR